MRAPSTLRVLPLEDVAASTTGFWSRSSTFGTMVAATKALVARPATTTGQVKPSNRTLRRIGSSRSSAERAASPVAIANASTATGSGPASSQVPSTTMTGQCQR